MGYPAVNLNDAIKLAIAQNHTTLCLKKRPNFETV